MTRRIRLGLRENWQQFTLLVVVNIFVGAMVYPPLLAAISDVAYPTWRGSAVGVYRLWRDLGYAIGALLAGLLADALGIPFAIAAIGGLTLLSGIIVAIVMRETLPQKGLI